MIYDKDANFPYPVLSLRSDSYKDNEFILKVDLDENTSDYKFKLDYTISSDFINDLIEKGEAQLVFIIRSGDSRFFNIKSHQKVLEIPKSRLSLSKRTELQLLIQSKREVEFKENYDLNSFYSEFKDEIVVPSNSLLGFSNKVIFDGSNNKPYELFEKKVDPSIKSDIKIDFTSETIVIVYKNESLQFRNLSNTFSNPFVYMGLQKSLYRFIANNSEDNDEVDLNNMEVPSDGLDFKLYTLMKRKMIDEVSTENIDEVIYAISDKILEKYSVAVGRLQGDGN